MTAKARTSAKSFPFVFTRRFFVIWILIIFVLGVSIWKPIVASLPVSAKENYLVPNTIVLPKDPFVVYSTSHSGLWGGDSTELFSDGRVVQMNSSGPGVEHPVYRTLKVIPKEYVLELIRTIYATGITEKSCNTTMMMADNYYFASVATPEKSMRVDGENTCSSDFSIIRAKYEAIFAEVPDGYGVKE